MLMQECAEYQPGGLLNPRAIVAAGRRIDLNPGAIVAAGRRIDLNPGAIVATGRRIDLFSDAGRGQKRHRECDYR